MYACGITSIESRVVLPPCMPLRQRMLGVHWISFSHGNERLPLSTTWFDIVGVVCCHLVVSGKPRHTWPGQLLAWLSPRHAHGILHA